MKTLIYFFLATILLSSCGVSRSNFSKRKHLKGHFWNSKGEWTSKKSDAERSKNIYTSEELLELKTTEEIDVRREAMGNLMEPEENQFSEVYIENKTAGEELKGEALDQEEKLHESETSSNTSESKRIIKSSDFIGFLIGLAIAVFFLCLILGFIGLIASVVFLFIGGFILWLFVVSLIIFVIPMTLLIMLGIALN